MFDVYLEKIDVTLCSSTGLDATCELCGFDFENRKALASHARAHLRQLGVDWKTLGSPIETLTAWMKSEPKKVEDLHKRYLKGDLPFVKKVSPYPNVLEIIWSRLKKNH